MDAVHTQNNALGFHLLGLLHSEPGKVHANPELIVRQQYEGVGSFGEEPRTKAELKEAEQRHNDCIDNLPPWCEWGERGEPARWEIMRSVARGYLLAPHDAVMILLMRERFSPISEGHRIDLLRWARGLYLKGMDRCYAVVDAMREDDDARRNCETRNPENLDDEYDDAQLERMDAEDIVYGIANAPVDRDARPEDLDLENVKLPAAMRRLVSERKLGDEIDPGAARVALLRYAISQSTTDLGVEEVVAATFDDGRQTIRATFRVLGGGIETYEVLKGSYGKWPFWIMRQRDLAGGRLVVGKGDRWGRQWALQGKFEFDWQNATCPSAEREIAVAQSFDW